jgi:aminopeptidase
MPVSGQSSAPVIALARKNIEEVLSRCLEHGPGAGAVIVFDEDSPLARLLAQAYREALPGAAAIDFSRTPPVEILERLERLRPRDLIVLLESSRFRLARHRLRVELFQAGLKVIEHPHLARVREDEIPVYVDALAYDEEHFEKVAPALKGKIDCARGARLLGAGAELIYDTAFEEARLNTGDYRGGGNVGGQFPIGEVFTEPREIDRVNGTVKLFAFGDADFTVNVPASPFSIVVQKGALVEAPEAPPEFSAILGQIRSEEGRVWLRELGFGLNRAMSRERRVSEIGTFERMCGIHISLGAKHAMYPKAAFPKKRTHFHVDVFPVVDRVEIDGETVFQGGRYKMDLNRITSPSRTT